MPMLMQLWNDWELQLLVLLSFTLQIFVFFSGGLRRCSTNSGLRLLIWLAYLLSDVVAVYALGQLSLHESDVPGAGEMHRLSFFWTPFLLIHLGGQDTITAFSIEDNELWPRHMLNLLAQVGLALYVFWKSSAHSQFLIPAIFVFVAGIIKYVERTWALKCASRNALRDDDSTYVKTGQFPDLLVEGKLELDYLTIVKYALSSAPGVRNLFVGRKLAKMEGNMQTTFTAGNVFQVPADGQHIFKILEIELGLMYDNLYTKARVVRTWLGAILRCLTHISLVVAFVLFLVGNKQRYYSRVDVAITYALFIGAFCTEVCAVFLMVMMSPCTWAFLESCKCRRLARVAWSIFKSLQPESRPRWSNSMGQYNFLNSCCFSESMMGKMMNLVGAKELWRNFRHTKSVKIKAELKNAIFETKHHPGLLHGGTSPSPGLGPALDTILQKPFEEAILFLHVYTDMFLHRYKNPSGTSCDITEKARQLMDTCRRISEYMIYLLVLHPTMLTMASSNISDILKEASESVANAGAIGCTKERFLDKLATDQYLYAPSSPVLLAGFVFQGERPCHESLEFLAYAWAMILLCVAGKSHGEEHAKQLSTGGELLTFVWLYMAHLSLGDMGNVELELVRPSGINEEGGGRKAFIFDNQRPR
ncbi:unnamed protein product [Triticum aestivum]|uniref:DUF4220 domain-containing protein n=2 Tax=Triticum aestivum TaxID=4565 RepID=A0A9R1F043_WHEAT|nr:uncharacterized protein LOC123055234 [Triticum aestivum]KAF7019663.1 hypothetical protein CFC21_032819 [Triticum aestivum]SPT20943.1 unnamed protein product [Triticum aestivum]